MTQIELNPEMPIDEYGTRTVGKWGGYLIQVMPMIYNDRLVMTPESCTGVYDYGWCYPKGGAALLAALLWDPEVDAEPPGPFIKAVAPGRKAGEKAGDTANGAAAVALLLAALIDLEAP